MTATLTDRLNQILPKVTSEAFLAAAALATRLPFTSSPTLRRPSCVSVTISVSCSTHIPKTNPRVRVQHVNLLDFVLDYLRQRNLLDKAIAMQQTKGDAFVLRQLARPSPPQSDRRRVRGGGAAGPA